MLLEIESATSADKTIVELAIKIEVTKHQTDEPLKFEPANVVLGWEQPGTTLDAGREMPEKYPVSNLRRNWAESEPTRVVLDRKQIRHVGEVSGEPLSEDTWDGEGVPKGQAEGVGAGGRLMNKKRVDLFATQCNLAAQ